MPFPPQRFRVTVTAINEPASVGDADRAEQLKLPPVPNDEIFRQTFDELDVSAVIAFLNKPRRKRKT